MCCLARPKHSRPSNCLENKADKKKTRQDVLLGVALLPLDALRVVYPRGWAGDVRVIAPWRKRHNHKRAQDTNLGPSLCIPFRTSAVSSKEHQLRKHQSRLPKTFLILSSSLTENQNAPQACLLRPPPRRPLHLICHVKRQNPLLQHPKLRRVLQHPRRPQLTALAVKLGGISSARTESLNSNCSVTVYADSNCSDNLLTAGRGQCLATSGRINSFSYDC